MESDRTFIIVCISKEYYVETIIHKSTTKVYTNLYLPRS